MLCFILVLIAAKGEESIDELSSTLSPIRLVARRFADSATLPLLTKKALSERPIFPKLSPVFTLMIKVERY